MAMVVLKFVTFHSSFAIQSGKIQLQVRDGITLPQSDLEGDTVNI